MRSLLALGLVLLLTSCAQTPPRESGANLPVPEQWAEGSDDPAAPPEAWWALFQDEGLNALIEEGLRQNHDLESAVSRLDAALAEAKIAGADLYPKIGAGWSGTKDQRNFIGFPIPGSGSDVLTTRTTTYGLNLNSSWELDLWGRIRAGRRAAKSEVYATESEVAAAYLSLAGQICKAWAAVVEAREQLALAEKTRESYQVTLDQIQFRYKRGVRTALEVRLATATLAGAEALLESRQIILGRSIRQLELLVGRYPSGALELGSSMPLISESVPVGLPAEMLGRRPDLVAALNRLKAADARVKASKAALLPRISLTANGGTSSEELADLLDRNFEVWTIAANLAQPILEGGRLRAGINLSKARTRQALADYRSAVLRAFSEVENALHAEEHLARREANLARASEASAAALELASRRYQSGLEEFITVLDTQRRSLEADTALVEVRRQRMENRVDLHLALGGGFGFSDPALQTTAARPGDIRKPRDSNGS